MVAMATSHISEVDDDNDCQVEDKSKSIKDPLQHSCQPPVRSSGRRKTKTLKLIQNEANEEEFGLSRKRAASEDQERPFSKCKRGFHSSPVRILSRPSHLNHPGQKNLTVLEKGEQCYSPTTESLKKEDVEFDNVEEEEEKDDGDGEGEAKEENQEEENLISSAHNHVGQSHEVRQVAASAATAAVDVSHTSAPTSPGIEPKNLLVKRKHGSSQQAHGSSHAAGEPICATEIKKSATDVCKLSCLSPAERIRRFAGIALDDDDNDNPSESLVERYYGIARKEFCRCDKSTLSGVGDTEETTTDLIKAPMSTPSIGQPVKASKAEAPARSEDFVPAAPPPVQRYQMPMSLKARVSTMRMHPALSTQRRVDRTRFPFHNGQQPTTPISTSPHSDSRGGVNVGSKPKMAERTSCFYPAFVNGPTERLQPPYIGVPMFRVCYQTPIGNHNSYAMQPPSQNSYYGGVQSFASHLGHCPNHEVPGISASSTQTRSVRTPLARWHVPNSFVSQAGSSSNSTASVTELN